MMLVVQALLPVMLLIVLGFALRKSGAVPAEHWRGIESLLYWLLFPAMLVVTMARSQVSFSSLSSFALALFLMVLLLTLVAYTLRMPLKHLLGMGGPTFTSFFQTSTRWHGFIAFAIIERLFGLHGVAVLAVAFAVMIPWLNIANITVLAVHAAHTRPTPRMVIMQLLKNPILWGIAIGIGWKLAALPAGGIAFTTLELLGRGALGISLLALGAGLSWQALKNARREVLLTVAIKLLFAPLIAFALAWLLNVHGEARVIMIVAASVPTAVNGYVLARKMGGDAEFYAAAATAQVVASFLTMPLFIWWALNLS